MTTATHLSWHRLLAILLIAALLWGVLPMAEVKAVTQTQINDSIDEGVAYLVTQQNGDGSWPGGFAADTGFALGVLEHYAEHLGTTPLSASYVYRTNVQNGLNYLLSTASYDPGNGWVYWNVPASYNAYQTGPCLLGIARSGAPNAVVSGTSNGLNGKTYFQVAQMVVDWLGSAQIKTGEATGAWYYRKDPFQMTGDQSATGWATLGLGYAVHSMGCTWPAGLLDRLALWNEYIQYHDVGPDFGGAGYMGPGSWTNTYKTGHLLFAQGLTGLTASSPRVLDALTFMNTHWNDLTNGYQSYNSYGWRGNPAGELLPSYIATIAATKGFTELGIETFNGRDWYQDFADVIVPNQHADGHWRGGGYGEFTDVRSTCWALLTLLRATSFVPPTVATKAATNVCMNTVTLNGFLASMGTSSSVNVSFEYGTSSGVYTEQTFGEVLTSAPASFSADIDGLAEEMTYYFRVKAEGDATAYGDEMSFETTAYPCNQTVDLLPPIIKFPDFSAWPGVTGASGTSIPDKGVPTFTVRNSTFGLQFIVEDDSTLGVQWSLAVAGRIAVIGSGTGTFAKTLQLLDGSNDVVVTAVDVSGNMMTRRLAVSVDSHAPVVTLARPLSEMISGSTLNIEGTVVDADSGVASLVIGGVDVAPLMDGTFSVTLPIKRGANSIAVEATDKAGNTGTDTWTLNLSSSLSRVLHTMELVVGQKSVIVDGIAAEADAAPVIIEDRIFLPLRLLIERVGGSISWQAATRQVTVKSRGATIVLTIGKSMAIVNGAATAIDPANAKVVPVIVGERTLLPLRFVAESLGLDITWNSGLKTAIVAWEP